MLLPLCLARSLAPLAVASLLGVAGTALAALVFAARLADASDEVRLAAAKAFRVYYAKTIPEGEPEDTDSYLMDHSSFVYLMDRDGQFVRHFNYGTSPEDMAKGVTEAVKKNG